MNRYVSHMDTLSLMVNKLFPFFASLRLCAFAFNLFFFHSFLCALDDEVIAKRIHAHILIHDYGSACQEAKNALQISPENEILWEWYVKALAANGNEKEMMWAWNNYSKISKKPFEQHTLLEAMAWGILEQGSTSSSPIIRTLALQGAFFGHDAKSVSMIYKHYSDQNSFVRWAAVKLSSHMRDAKLCDAIQELLFKEKNARVRLEIVKAVGEMKLKKALPTLLGIVSGDHTSAEEKFIATQSIVAMLDQINYPEIKHLASSDRAGLRVVACSLIEHYEKREAIGELVNLVKDRSGDVRAAALHALGILKIKEFQHRSITDLAATLLNDQDPNVAIMAAWLLTLHDFNTQNSFNYWLNHQRRDLQLLAAGALSACGKHSATLMHATFQKATDPYVRANLALGLIGQQIAVQQACEVLCCSLKTLNERWMWKEGAFRVLAPSDIKHDDSVPQYPEEVDQLVRLEILNTIAIMRYPEAQTAVACMLKQKMWGITGTAAALLLTECDEEALNLVKGLLHASENNVRMQAALILALWGRDEEAIATLQDGYKTADRQMKEKILEAIGRIGSESSIPFLVEHMNESSQTLRIISASALLQTLYH